MKKIIFRWGPVILWAVIIFTISSIPTLPKSKIIWWDFILKKTAHVVEYAILSFLLIRGLTNTASSQLFPKKVKPYALIIAFIFAVIYAFSDEFHQSFVPGRTSKLRDVGFDTLGSLISLYIIKSKSS